MRSQLLSGEGILNLALVGLVLVTAVALIVCALKSFNTYNYYSIPGGNDKYLVPNRIMFAAGALTFLGAIFGIFVTSNDITPMVLIMLTSSGWVLALLNLIIVKKDREEREKEEPKRVKLF